jgi:ribonuclease HI
VSRIGRPRQRYILYTDGAARGNPGPAGAGAVLLDPEGNRIAEVSEYLGRSTNNVAEYRALLLGLERAREFGARDLEVRSDSLLVVKQMREEYEVRKPHLEALRDRARELERSFRRVKYMHVPRASNSDADLLANRAIDAASASTDVQKSPRNHTKSS